MYGCERDMLGCSFLTLAAAPVRQFVDASTRGESMSGSLRVMLADDHETVRQGLRALFQTVPNVEVVHDVADGDAALDAIRTLAPDLVVIDLSMSPADGLTVMRRVKADGRATKLVVLTRYREAGYVREAFAAGALGYVLKQSPFSELRRAVEAAGRGEPYLDPALRFPVSATQLAAPLEIAAEASERELDVLRRAVRGQSHRAIAAALDIAVKTVEAHKANGMRKLGLHGRSQMLRYAVLHGWLLDA